nr:immunoglobulin light chain junction region [Macaca mulatta]
EYYCWLHYSGSGLF